MAYYEADGTEVTKADVAEDVRCDGYGEIYVNRTGNPWDDDSYECPGCVDCEDDDEVDIESIKAATAFLRASKAAR